MFSFVFLGHEFWSLGCTFSSQSSRFWCEVYKYPQVVRSLRTHTWCTSTVLLVACVIVKHKRFSTSIRHYSSSAGEPHQSQKEIGQKALLLGVEYPMPYCSTPSPGFHVVDESSHLLRSHIAVVRSGGEVHSFRVGSVEFLHDPLQTFLLKGF